MPILVVWIIVALLCARTLVLSIVLPLVEAYPLHRPTIRFALTDLWVLVAQCGLASLLWFLQRDVRQLFSDSGQIWMQIGGTVCICLGWLYGVRLLTYAKVEATDLRAIGLFILLLGYIYSLLAGFAAVYLLVLFPGYPLHSIAGFIVIVLATLFLNRVLDRLVLISERRKVEQAPPGK